jgi:nitrogen fixation protein FixH
MKTCTVNFENWSRRFWFMMILLLMGINLGIAVIAVKMAVGDISIRPMPDYGEQAVTWQERIDAMKQSKALGWTCGLSMPSDASMVSIDLRDENGDEISGGTGHVRVFHFTAAGQVQVAPIESSEAGGYQVAIGLKKPGLWQISIDLRKPTGEKYVSDETWCLSPDGTLKRETHIR